MNAGIKHRIVIVDDDSIIREIVGEILLSEGYEVEQFSNTADAETYLKNNNVSLLFLDVSMPVEDGYTFMARLKKQNYFKDLPVIFMTGKGAIDDKVQGFELGAVDYIVKPFHRMDVLMRAKAHIKIVETHNENKEKLSQIEKAHQSLMVQPQDIPEAKFGVYFKSLLEAGGDFYEVLKLDENRYVYFIADISGHDIATSYVMPAVKALMKQCFKDSSALQEELNSFNKSVKESIPESKFITALMILLDRKDNSALVVNMGHIPPVIKPFNANAYLAELDGDVLGVHNNPIFGVQNLHLSKGDKIILFTDGLLESGTKIWPEELKSLPEKIDELSSESLDKECKALIQKMGASQNSGDDILLMMVEV